MTTYLIESTEGLRANDARRIARGTEALQLIDDAAQPMRHLRYAFTTPFSMRQAKAAMLLGELRTSFALMAGSTSGHNRRGIVGDALADFQGALAEVVLGQLMLDAFGIDDFGALLRVRAQPGPDFEALGCSYDFKAVGLIADTLAYRETVCINTAKEPEVYIVARLDFDDMKLHVYAVEGKTVRDGGWRRVTGKAKFGRSDYYEGLMPDRAEFKRRKAPRWVREYLAEVLLKHGDEEGGEQETKPIE